MTSAETSTRWRGRSGTSPRAVRPPTITMARSTANRRSSRSNTRRGAAQRVRVGAVSAMTWDTLSRALRGSSRPGRRGDAGGRRLLATQERQGEKREQPDHAHRDEQPPEPRVVLLADAEDLVEIAGAELARGEGQVHERGDDREHGGLRPA